MRIARWTLILGLVTTAAAATPGAAQNRRPIQDPIRTQPIQSGLGIRLTEVARLPRSSTFPTAPGDGRLVRWNRINYLGEIPDGSGRLYVPDLNGTLYTIENGTPHAYFDVRARLGQAFFSRRGLGQGFGFVTFHPRFRTNGRFYTVHTELASGAGRRPDLTRQRNTVYHGVITEWTAADPSASTFSGTRREVLRLGFAGPIHGIQQIDFNPEAEPGDRDFGLLYIAVGDGGRGVRSDEPQNLAMPHGKLLRIDPLRRNSSNRRYGIPAGNPFVGRPRALGEVYAVGFRDPHRFSWDPGGRHRMFLGHIGEHAIEAVDEIKPGANFGWSKREGPFVYDKTPAGPCAKILPLPRNDRGYTYPVVAYDHDAPPGWDCKSDLGHGIIGGFVYRGSAVPRLRGKYVFADLVTGQLFYTRAARMVTGRPRAPIHELMVYDGAGRRTTTRRLLNADGLGDPDRVDLRFGRDAEGELYVLSKGNGRIWKITDTQRFASCAAGATTVTGVMGAGDWAPITPAKWRFPGDQVVLARPGDRRPGPRRPFEYAVLTEGPVFGSLHLSGRVRIDTPVRISGRDVVVLFGHRSDTEFYYAQLSSNNTRLTNNGIFRVDDANQVRIDDQWLGHHGAPPAIRDARWHRVRVTHCAASGEIAVYMDNSRFPLMTAVDGTFGSGRVGFGSFDNVGRLRGLTVTGTALP